MKINIYYQNDVPVQGKADFWVHFIYCNTSGWISMEYEEEECDNSVEICEEIIDKMEIDAGRENGIPDNEIVIQIDGYHYYHNEINSLNIVEAVPYRGETSLFIWEY